eukprot:2430286-Alexandrium_andersonii.AAC.1
MRLAQRGTPAQHVARPLSRCNPWERLSRTIPLKEWPGGGQRRGRRASARQQPKSSPGQG